MALFSQILSVVPTVLSKLEADGADVVFEPSGEKFDPLNVEIRTLISVIKNTPMMLIFENLLASFIWVF